MHKSERPLHAKHDRKALQLCAQVGRAVGDALTLSEDLRLSSLYVASVIPDPGIHRLLITLHMDTYADADLGTLQDLLERSHSRIRSEVADAITRRKVPHLSFVVLEAPEYP